MKKKLCVIGLAEVVCDAMGARLRSLIGEYAEIMCWCLETSANAPPRGYDLYLATYPGTYEYAKRILPDGTPILLAGRFVNPSNFDRLLELPKGTHVLAVDNSLERAKYLMWEIARFGINHLDISPYYPGGPEPADMDQAVAIGAGRKKNVPDGMEFIDLGVKDITITTYAEILRALSISDNVLNAIAHTYMDSVFETARRSNKLRTRRDTIINNIDEIILGIDEKGAIIFKNHAAEGLIASVGKTDALRFGDVFTELEHPFSYYYENSNEEIVTRINNLYYVLQIKPVAEPIGGNIGAIIIVKPVNRVQELENKVRRKLKGTGLTAKYSFADILGKSPAIRQAVEIARKFADTSLTVLLESESGTGKELFAQSIHQASACANGPFVAFNFSALPETLAESELFGYEEGAFTGARRGGKPGLFEQAHNGTIFLDELGSASLGVQARLLRVLEEREVRRIGGERVLPISVRVIAATNESLGAMIRDKQFRQDLFYRICTCPLYIPPLRKRKGDVLLLAKHFAETHHAHNLKFDRALEDFCNTYDWPGNVRELQNMVTYLCTVVPSGRTCTIADLPRYFQSASYSPNVDEKEQMLLATLREELMKNGTLDICKAILSIYSTKTKGRNMGREPLFSLLKNNDDDITYPALRRHLGVLKRHDMLHAGSTKQGTEITPLGREFLNYVNRVKP
ncbi:hypothetical protein B4923_15070 [Brenneria roseae subsp. americana]|uniref:Sigma-54 factor interaction domain-containing protein n=1 Tax=Brenneria roseae subsp. americana TaxID=1508507 RepID=A0A2U1TN50_9GAMM|nr:sigma 54-interacting transcriptional regulator [Brenneria roseae]PWC10835.1 hypothetical protein B4923_15070 [Brenneria roseae subsp. americana]